MTDSTDLIQGSREWFSARLGKATASRIADVMAKGRGGNPSATRKNYLYQLLCERLTGNREETFTNAAMERGTELEPIARAAYEIHTGNTVTETGFCVYEGLAMGASCDGLVGEDGLCEIKNPNTAQHIACIQSGEADPKYLKQMHFQMLCTGRKWNDYISFDDRLPEELQLFICRVERDDAFISEMLVEVTKFLKELDELESEMRERMTA